MDYKNFSDFEVNAHVTMWQNGFTWLEFLDDSNSHIKCGNEKSPGFSVIEVNDYCNNASNAWQIIKDYRITVTFDDETGAHIGADYEFYDENGLKAAMVAYLKMENAKLNN